jgi:hypothetical protein
MAKSSFGSRFHDLKYFEVGFFLIFLESIKNLRAPLQNFVGKKTLFYFIIYKANIRQLCIQ